LTTTRAPNAVDLQGFESLRRSAARNDPKATAEAAVQFEALFVGLMLKSAREANLGSGMFDSSETQQYLELMDQQVALEMARNGGLGFGTALLKQLAPAENAPPAAPGASPASSSPPGAHAAPLTPAAAPPAAPLDSQPQATAGGAWYQSWAEPDGFAEPAAPASETDREPRSAAVPAEPGGSAAPPAGTPEAFIASLLPQAEAAARVLGVEPRVLLAQAALETGWGRATPQHGDGRSTHNLFGVKAGAEWRGERTAQWTAEQIDGAAERRRADFRAYPSTAASFADYVDLIGGTPRYAQAVTRAGDAEAYARAVTAAGYATDPHYADKWLSIYHGDRLESALRGLKSGAIEPTQ
jgi:flagellar protein FlgJ